jgi:RNA polymerase sigma factor FliA
MRIALSELQKLLGEISSLEIGSLRTISRADRKKTCANFWPMIPTTLGPLTQFLQSEMRELLLRAIAELPEKERQVLVLYYFEELTMKEVGIALGVGESRVSQIHSGAVARLRARMTELTVSRGTAARGATASR